MYWFVTLPLQFSVCPDCAHLLHCPSLPHHLGHSLSHDLTRVSIPCLTLIVLRRVSALYLKFFFMEDSAECEKGFFLIPWCPILLSFMLSFWQHKYTWSRASNTFLKKWKIEVIFHSWFCNQKLFMSMKLLRGLSLLSCDCRKLLYPEWIKGMYTD